MITKHNYGANGPSIIPVLILYLPRIMFSELAFTLSSSIHVVSRLTFWLANCSIVGLVHSMLHGSKGSNAALPSGLR